MKIVLENRWYTKTGKAKRVPAALSTLSYFAEQNKHHILASDMIQLTKAFRERYQIGLADALDCAVAFMGMYENDIKTHLFNMERFERGMRMISNVTR